VERVADDVIVLLNGTVAAHESVDALKRSVSEVTISVPQQRESAVPEVPGKIVAHVVCGSDHIWIVRDLDIDRLSETCRRQNLPAPVVRKPTLEETLLIMLRQLRQESREHTQESTAPVEQSSKNKAATF
jgi:ABC-type multidrug transport system ATPase subunit